jgi:hypothetical protein
MYAGSLGGGASGARSGGGYADSSEGGAYSKYMPTKASAARAPSTAAAEVSGAGGKDNFQKVTERMRDLRSSLIANP